MKALGLGFREDSEGQTDLEFLIDTLKGLSPFSVQFNSQHLLLVSLEICSLREDFQADAIADLATVDSA
jgi:hypothetical protein